AVERRHLDVEEGGIGAVRPARLQRGVAVVGLDDLVAVVLQVLAHDGTHHQRVLGDDDLPARSPGTHARSTGAPTAAASTTSTIVPARLTTPVTTPPCWPDGAGPMSPSSTLTTPATSSTSNPNG